jgi:hypothetical protein
MLNILKYFLYGLYVALVIVITIWLATTFSARYATSLMLVAVLALVIPAGLLVKRNLDIFEPILLFSTFYYSAVISALFLLSNNLHEPKALPGISTITSFNNAIIWLIVGYIFFALGYHVFITRKQIRYISFRPGNIPKSMLKVVAFIFIAISLTWFVYMVRTLSGNPLTHLQRVAILPHEYREEGLSTALYQLGYMGMYLWFYIWLQTRKHTFLLLLGILITFLMYFSTARVTGSITYLLSFVVLYRYSLPRSPGNTHKISLKNMRKMSLIVPVIVVVGVILFIFRFASSEYVNNRGNLGNVFQTTLLSDQGIKRIVEGGNLLSVPVLITIFSSWEDRIGFLWGESLLWSVLGCIPRTIRALLHLPEDVPMVAKMIRDTWYIRLGFTGGFPPSFVGELFVNFGYIGIPIGMFLFGGGCAFIYNTMQKYRNYWILLLYTAILTRFIFISSRASFSNIQGILWMAGPTLIVVCLLIGLQVIMTQRLGKRSGG